MTQRKKTADVNVSVTEGLQLGLPSARLQKLLASVTVAEPYAITDGLVIPAPDKRRRDAMREAQTNLIIHSQSLERAYQRVGPPRPEYPKMPAPPAPLEKGADPDAFNSAVEAYGTAVEHWQKLVSEWNLQNTEWEAGGQRMQEALDDLNAKIAEDQAAYSRALFGDQHEAVDEFFDGQPPELWDVFVEDIKQEFGIIPKPAQLPDPGTDEDGNVVDEEAAGKGGTSSTGSKTTGTQ